MPTISERQLFIQEILHVVSDLEQLSHMSRMALDADEMLSSDSESSSDSSSSSSQSSSSISLSGSEEFMSVDSDGTVTDTDEERTITMGMTADLLQVIAETCVLNPNLVAKCSQLDLILVDFKFHDPKCFRHNL